MFKSAEIGKLEVIKFLIENGFDINKKDDKGETPIFKSISNKCFGVSKYLFEHGAKVGFRNKKGESLEMLINKCDNQLIRNYFISRSRMEESNKPLSQNSKTQINESTSKSDIPKEISNQNKPKSNNNKRNKNYETSKVRIITKKVAKGKTKSTHHLKRY